MAAGEEQDPADRLEAYQRFLVRQREPSARDTLRIARDTRLKREAQEQATTDAVESRWQDGWAFWDSVTFSLQQNGLHMLERSGTEDGHSPMREALLLLHFSATITFQEIRALLRAGYWAGAAARWRALHEVTVTSVVVAQGGVEVAKRYLDHGYVVQTRRLAEYMDAHNRGPVSATELEERRRRSDDLVEQHSLSDQSASFRNAYGWAAPLMPKGKNQRRIPPSFDRLERIAGLSQHRLLVATAHGLVHNDSGGVLTAVVAQPTEWALGPIHHFIDTVARPALLSVQHAVPATHFGFEPDLNDFARLLGLFGTTTVTLATQAFAAFEQPNEPQIDRP